VAPTTSAAARPSTLVTPLATTVGMPASALPLASVIGTHVAAPVACATVPSPTCSTNDCPASKNVLPSFWLAMAVTLAVGTVAGLVAAVISIRARGVYFALITFGLAQVVAKVVFNTPRLGASDGIIGIPVITIDLVGFTVDTGNARAFFLFYRDHPRDLDLGFYLFRGVQPRGLTPALDESLNARLRDALEPTHRALLSLGLDAAAAQAETTALFAQAVGVLLLTHTGRIRMFRQDPLALFERYVEALMARVAPASRPRARRAVAREPRA